MKMYNCRLDPELHRKMKICAAENEISMQQLVIQAIKAEMKLLKTMKKQTRLIKK
jgi:predicted HicB family RNase H-like nuclease